MNRDDINKMLAEGQKQLTKAQQTAANARDVVIRIDARISFLEQLLVNEPPLAPPDWEP